MHLREEGQGFHVPRDVWKWLGTRTIPIQSAHWRVICRSPSRLVRRRYRRRSSRDAAVPLLVSVSRDHALQSVAITNDGELPSASGPLVYDGDRCSGRRPRSGEGDGRLYANCAMDATELRPGVTCKAHLERRMGALRRTKERAARGWRRKGVEQSEGPRMATMAAPGHDGWRIRVEPACIHAFR